MGTFCSECDEGSFYLSEQHEFGCVRCFCMGHTKICDSTTYNRAQVSSSLSLHDTHDKRSFVLNTPGDSWYQNFQKH